MKFGEWELRDDASYYLSKDSMIWPSSNAVDEGKLTTEENMRNIYRYLGLRNFVTKYNYFSLSLNVNRNGVVVSPGEAVIQGYHFYSKSAIDVKVPNNTEYDENGHIKANQRIDEYVLGLSLSYDAANHVTGDIVNKAEQVGSSETLSGVYLKWFDKCQLECNYNNILVLGRAWVKAGMIVPDGTKSGNRIIYHGFEADPFKDHIYNAKNVEIEVHGHKTTKYDTLRDNMTQIHEPLYTYDSTHFPIELERKDRTKPPTHVTDIQDFINHIPDWYTSKYGDYMTGTLRFNNLSIDAKREFAKLPITKDSITNDAYGDSVFISPRTYGNLTRSDSDTVASMKDSLTGEEIGVKYDYNVGGTLMTIVPNTYSKTTDWNFGYTGIHAALVSQLYGETGLRLHYGKGIENDKYNTTRLVHYNKLDDGCEYNSLSKNKNVSENTSNFIIENINKDGRIVSIDFRNGELFIDSFNSPTVNVSDEQRVTGTSGESQGSGIQIYTSGSNTEVINNIDFRFDESYVSMAKHKYENHRNGTRGTNLLGKDTDDMYFKLGVGIGKLGNYEINTDPYLQLGNLLFRSNNVYGSDYKQNTISIFNTNNDELPYIRLWPRALSKQYLAEEIIQVGTSKMDDYYNDSAQDTTFNRIIMKRVGSNANDTNNIAYTYLEQDYKVNNGGSVIINKWLPPIKGTDILGVYGSTLTPNYAEIAGMYSAGNIGCSNNKSMYTSRSDDIQNNPYNDNDEWVRFTRFRYDLDRDQVNGGTNTLAHDSTNGRKWGDTYNIEFNTNVANRRANQIIWRYNGSKGTQDENSINNTPPVVLSYIHDNTSIKQGTPTKYSIDNNGVFESWIDHAGITQYNPTYKTRDFLLLENAGLTITGDVNNPSLNGDSLNANNHLGVTIVSGRVYNAVYNDFAETYEKDNKDEIAKVGEIITLNPETGKYKISDSYEDKCVVGVQSNSYAFLAGGNRVNNTQDIIELENEYFTVGISGKVWVRVINESEDCLNCYISPGDLLTTSSVKGKACKSKYLVQGTIIGKALTKPKYFEEYKCDMVLMQIMLG